MTRVFAAIVALCLLALAYGTITDRALRKHYQSDREGAKNVRDTTQQTLDGIPADVDPDDLLNDTNGLRDD